MARKLKPKTPANKIVYRAGARIGFADAEDDIEFLEKCYVDTGQVKQALDTEDPGSIILGRTGCGKTAAILHIKEIEDHVISIEPENLALNYISNSNILSFFHGLGVNLDLFFQLLWRHVLCVELLNYHYKIRNVSDFKTAWNGLKELLVEDKGKNLALDYLETWGAHFWEETQQRVRQIVEKFEDELQAGLDLEKIGVPLNARGSTKIFGEEKSELVSHASNVVNKVQIKSLSAIMDLMADDIFTNKQVKYYIVIDKLDENWVDDDLRYKLIRALIETIKAFRKIRTVKLVIALRVDLIERIYKYTRSGGFQEEKYEDFNVYIKWNNDELFKLVDSRVADLFKRKYTRTGVHFHDIFPRRYRQNGHMFDYLVQRTQLRPRDIIAFVNQVFIEAIGKSTITASDIDRAELEYSKKRLRALCIEWQEEHPFLELCIEAFRNLPTRLRMSDLSEHSLTKMILSLCDKTDAPDRMPQLAVCFMEDTCTFEDFRAHMIRILYKVGAVGVKPTSSEAVHFSFQSSYVPGLEDLDPTVRLSIAPMLWRALGNPRVRRRGDVLG